MDELGPERIRTMKDVHFGYITQKRRKFTLNIGIIIIIIQQELKEIGGGNVTISSSLMFFLPLTPPPYPPFFFHFNLSNIFLFQACRDLFVISSRITSLILHFSYFFFSSFLFVDFTTPESSKMTSHPIWNFLCWCRFNVEHAVVRGIHEHIECPI